MSTLLNLLPDKAKRTNLIAGRIPTDIYREVRIHMAKDRLSFADLLTAMCKHFLQEKKNKKSGKDC